MIVKKCPIDSFVFRSKNYGIRSMVTDKWKVRPNRYCPRIQYITSLYCQKPAYVKGSQATD